MSRTLAARARSPSLDFDRGCGFPVVVEVENGSEIVVEPDREVPEKQAPLHPYRLDQEDQIVVNVALAAAQVSSLGTGPGPQSSLDPVDATASVQEDELGRHKAALAAGLRPQKSD